MKRHKRAKGKYSPFKYFPCLRCGQTTVAALIPQPTDELEMGDLTCKRCATPHYLIARKQGGMWWAIYDRDTRRYPSDHYDEPPSLKLAPQKKVPLTHPGNDEAPYPQHGPIFIYQRKRFSPEEARQVWRQSGGWCHLCENKRWKLNERGRWGWHIDHVIPNIGGGWDTEMMDNFRVACAICNLRKGKGYTERTIRNVLQSLFV